ncbi:MAG: pyrroline-5-carboxylate reductase [Bacteroidetes bacterium 4572_117]|nr:MAG: pyrroline-5-carboxylate reductase [Bacteroidetes bacterium 4572_117]
MTAKQNKKIAIIGGGNLGTSIAKGLVNSQFPAYNITVTRRKVERLQALAELGISTTSDNIKAVNSSNIIIIALKPYRLNAVLKEISNSLNPEKHILVSLVSGISIEKIKAGLNPDLPIFRAMPNTAIAINESMTCIAAPKATDNQKDTLTALFKGLGRSIIINEEMMDAATVLAACGIAFVMRFIRAMVQGGIEIGFDSKTASQIANQTVKGAAELLIQNGLHPEEEIDKVTTPKGFTISGLNEMEHNGFSSSLIKGILTSYNKIDQ